MPFGKSDRNDSGFTLLETMFALAVFMVVMGITAQGLINSFSIMILQEERTSALNDCRAVMSSLRQVAYTSPVSDECPEGTVLFPCALIQWIAGFPESLEFAAEDEDVFAIYGGFFSLPDQQFVITCVDEEGGVAEINPGVLEQNTNPVYVNVTTTWRGFRGHTFTLGMNSLLTNR